MLKHTCNALLFGSLILLNGCDNNNIPHVSSNTPEVPGTPETSENHEPADRLPDVAIPGEAIMADGNQAVIQLVDIANATGRSAVDYSSKNLLLWNNDTCNSLEKTSNGWEDTSITPTGHDTYGPYWVLPLNKTTGCINFILRDGTNKLIDADMRVTFSDFPDRTVSVLAGCTEVYDTRADAFNDKTVCQNKTDSGLSHVIPDYRRELSKKDVNYTFTEKERLPQVEVNRYKMASQSWSPDKMVTPEKWQHDVDIYIPETPRTQRALVVVNDGVNYDGSSGNSEKPTDFSEEVLADIARETHTIVISVSNIPNQYLIYQSDGKPLKEDDSVARSWVLFMDDPEQRKLIPLHIPMSTSVSQAMRMAKKELTQWSINKFIVTGASKRGWTTWLTAISDPDVEAIVPFVIDFLGIDAALEHMYRSYGGNWPVAFYPYYQQGIDKLLKTPDFLKLLEIEDPLRYMNSIYQSRLAIPKYIVNASGDDFYVPDNTRFYYDKLPGEKSLRVAPNTDHHGILNFTKQSLISFVNRYQSKRTLPQIDSLIHNKVLTVYFSEEPVKIIRWSAINTKARDFRYACGIIYTPSSIDIPSDNKVDVSLSYSSPGWEATYIEATFSDGYVGTTQVYITPDEKYVQAVPPSEGEACKTLPGRGLGD